MLLAGAVLAEPPDQHSGLVESGPPIALRPASQPASQTPEAWVWRGRDGEPLPFSDEDQLVEFLREAKVVSQTATEHGINRPLRVVLEWDGVTARAVFRTVDLTWRNERGPDGVRRRLYRDSYIYECAAYELSRLLGLDRVPPAVERRYRGRYGSIQAWVENARMEAELRRDQVRAPDVRRWVSRMMQRRLFDTLINNQDRNLGNTLVDEGWEVWLIDHGRSFQIDPDPKRIADDTLVFDHEYAMLRHACSPLTRHRIFCRNLLRRYPGRH